MLYTRLLFSCLVDADYTASAMNDDNAYLAHAEDSCFDPLMLLEKLYAYCRDIRQASTADKTLNRYRAWASAPFIFEYVVDSVPVRVSGQIH